MLELPDEPDVEAVDDLFDADELLEEDDVLDFDDEPDLDDFMDFDGLPGLKPWSPDGGPPLPLPLPLPLPGPWPSDGGPPLPLPGPFLCTLSSLSWPELVASWPGLSLTFSSASNCIAASVPFPVSSPYTLVITNVSSAT